MFCKWGGGGGRGECHRIGIPFSVDEDDEAMYGVCLFLMPKDLSLYPSTQGTPP